MAILKERAFTFNGPIKNKVKRDGERMVRRPSRR